MRIGVDLGGTKIEAAALGADGGIRARRRVPTPREDYAATVHAMADLVRALELEVKTTEPASAHAAPSRSLPTVGVATPGAVSPATGRMKNCNSTWLNGQPLREDLESALGRPIRLANDANCLALSEATDGAAAGLAVVFGVILGTGCGGGIAVRGGVLEGPNAIAGEWGHNPLPWPKPEEWPGPECYCGRQGCIETFVSGTGLARDHALRTGRFLSGEEIAARAATDATCRESLTAHSERLARALASVINLLDPDAIVLGGGLSSLDSLYEEVPRLWAPWVFSDRVDTKLLRPQHGDSSGVRGAAWLWPEGV